MTGEASRADEIVARARDWIGTPYRHQASCKGAGTDCLGLLRGVWREVLGAEPEAVPGYTPDWAEPGRSEELLAAAGPGVLLGSKMPHSLRNAVEGGVPVRLVRCGGEERVLLVR